MARLAGKVCVITGAASGIGEALAHALVHPGGIRTRIVESARVGSGVAPEEEDNRKQFATLLTINPAHAAAIIVEGIERRRGRVLIGWSAKVPDLLARLLPVSYGKILAIMMRIWTESGRAAAELEVAARTGKRL